MYLCDIWQLHWGGSHRDKTLKNWVVGLQYMAFKPRRHNNRALLLAEKGIPKQGMAASWQSGS